MNILGRKRELISRDPLGIKYESIFQSWLADRDDESLKEEKNGLEKVLEEKWRIRIYISEETIRGLDDRWDISGQNYTHSVRDGRDYVRFSYIDENKVLHFKQFDYDKDYIVYCPPPKIPIIIDPTMLTFHDAKLIKNKVWEIVANELKKLQNTNSKGWNPRIPQEEPIELAKVLRCKENTFKNYLRWYDLKTIGIPFRLIAQLERTINDSEQRGKRFKQISNLKRKPKIGNPVRGESAVRNGFNIIFTAIYRENPPSEEDKIETLGKYKCPEHGEDCPINCHYLKQFMLNYENKFPDSKLKEKLAFTTLQDIEEYQISKNRKKRPQV